MKIVLIIFGSFLIIFGSIKFFSLIGLYDKLPDYAKGYIWGNALLIVIGLILLFFGFKRKKEKQKSFSG